MGLSLDSLALQDIEKGAAEEIITGENAEEEGGDQETRRISWSSMKEVGSFVAGQDIFCLCGTRRLIAMLQKPAT